MNNKLNLKVELKLKVERLIYVFAILIICLTSCSPLSKIVYTNIQNQAITNDDYTKLNGIYSNSYDTIIGGIKHFPFDGKDDYDRITILYQLFCYNYPETAWRDEYNEMINPLEKWIKIEFHSKDYATISFYHNDVFVFSKRIHGEFKDGYFYVRPKVYVLPLIPLLFGYNFERARLGKTIDNNLVIDYSVNRWGFALVAGSSDKGIATTIYKNKNK